MHFSAFLFRGREVIDVVLRNFCDVTTEVTEESAGLLFSSSRKNKICRNILLFCFLCIRV